VNGPFEYTNLQPGFTLREADSNGIWRHYHAEFRIAFPGLWHNRDTAYGEYYRSSVPDKCPFAVLVHGWGDRSLVPMTALAKDLARNGIHAFVLYLPFHSRRMPKEMQRRRLSLTDDEWFAGYRIGVTDIRRVVEWSGDQAEVDHSRVCVIGLSLGSFMGAFAMAVDPRIKGGVFIVGGGNSGKIAQLSRMTLLHRRYRMARDVFEENQRLYHAYLNEVEAKGLENVEPARRTYLIDPLTYAQRLKDRPLLMINARWDGFIPRESTIEMWQAVGRCPLVWLPATHSTIWVFYRRIANYLLNFVKDEVGGGYDSTGS
jgi:dienelactone hydrolase